MKFTIIFEIYPPGQFGVPENGKTVIPAGPGSYIGDTFHRATMTRVGYGTLSCYRDENERISLTLNLGDISATIKDNFATFIIEANSPGEAFDIAVKAIDRFLQHLSLNMHQLFYYNILVMEDEQGKIYPVPKEVIMVSVTMYNLDRLIGEIENAAKFFQLSDPILDKALQYYEHSLYLYEKRTEIVDVLSRHFNYLISAVFLNMWKALTTIIGDPSIDKDYQSRYKRLGFGYEFFKSKIEYVKDIRNQYDVAHYHVEQDRIKKVEQNFGKAKEVVISVLKAYRQYIADGNSSFAETR